MASPHTKARVEYFEEIYFWYRKDILKDLYSSSASSPNVIKLLKHFSNLMLYMLIMITTLSKSSTWQNPVCIFPVKLHKLKQHRTRDNNNTPKLQLSFQGVLGSEEQEQVSVSRCRTLEPPLPPPSKEVPKGTPLIEKSSISGFLSALQGNKKCT